MVLIYLQGGKVAVTLMSGFSTNVVMKRCRLTGDQTGITSSELLIRADILGVDPNQRV